MRIWIDLSNSPHPLLFAPISRRLEVEGHEVVVTARDNAQTVELARARWREVTVIGGRTKPGRAAKGAAMVARIRDMVGWARAVRPDVGLSHNSYGQIVAARTLGIPAVTAMDYEHQPVNHLAFRLARRILLPAALRSASLERQGATAAKTRYYDGLKEEIYLGDFEPDPEILAAAGIDSGRERVVVVARTPPAGALYHREDNPLFGQIMQRIGEHEDVSCICLCRQPEQRQELTAMGLPNVALPERALEARSLLHAADLVIGAGGTMTREAALLEVPTVSIFAGRPAAVDKWLEERGALRRIEAIEDLPPLCHRRREPRAPAALRAREATLVEEFAVATLAAAGQ